MTHPYDTGGLRPATDAPTAGDVPPATAGAPESPATLLERLLKEVENTPGGNSNSGDNSNRGSGQAPPQADPAAAPGGANPTGNMAGGPTGGQAGGTAGGPAGGLAGSPMNGLMGSLLAHPELLQAIPTLINTLGPMMRTGGPGAPGAGTGGRTAGNAGGRTGGDPGGKPGGGAHPGGFHPDRHTPLLKAIKPYLGPERRQALETMIQLCQVWDTLQDLGISLLPPAADNRGT